MTDPAPTSAEVLVIGAGAGGAAVAWRLATRGVKVVVLEQGDFVPPNAAAAARPDADILRQRQWSPDPNIRRSPYDYPIDVSETPIRPALFNGVGGSTVLWTSHVPRFHPADFRTRSLDDYGDDWPLNYDDLEAYYDLNDEMTGVSGVSGDPAYPDRRSPRMPPVGLGIGGARLASAFNRLGWHWWPTDLALNTVRHAGRGPCVNSGPCELGCAVDAKATADNTYGRAARAAGARLITRARVTRVTHDEHGIADGAEYYDADGSLRHIAANVVIIAANGIGTPRLLLLSHSSRFPNGLANRSDMVGRRLMYHPIGYATGVFDEPLDGYKGITYCSLLSHEFYETDRTRGFVRGYQLQGGRSYSPLVTALGGFGLDVPWGAAHHERFADVFNRTVGLSVTTEDAPDPENRVTLSTSLTDSSGLAAPKIRYRVDENSRRMLAHGLDRAEEVLLEAGATQVLKNPLLDGAGFHLMGTARMGDDPSASVVDRWGRAHDVPNLFIADASVFVTSAGVNPTPTLQALAVRTADHILDTRHMLPTPAKKVRVQ